MLIDAPGVEEKGKSGSTSGGVTTEIALTDENAAEVMDLINRINR